MCPPVGTDGRVKNSERRAHTHTPILQPDDDDDALGGAPGAGARAGAALPRTTRPRWLSSRTATPRNKASSRAARTMRCAWRSFWSRSGHRRSALPRTIMPRWLSLRTLRCPWASFWSRRSRRRSALPTLMASFATPRASWESSPSPHRTLAIRVLLSPVDVVARPCCG